jgi:hypothetical protein
MTKRSRRLSGVLGVLAALFAVFAQAATASVPVDLRVASDDGGNLAEVRQYVPSTTTVKTFSGPDCLSSAKVSSGQSYTQGTPTMLGAIWEASQVEPSLQPVRLSDAYYADFGALGVCQINAKTPPGYFYLKANHQSLVVGADLFTVQGGEQLLAYRTPADFTADEELDLTAPVRTAPGSVPVNVRSYTSTVAPHPGATVLGGDAPAQTDVAGNATVNLSAPGVYRLTALGDYNDIPSPGLTVCVSTQPDRSCPAERGLEILGSDEAEGIKGTDGDDVIRPRAGTDGIKAGAGNDVIVANGGGRDRVFCGGGKDAVVRDRKDRVSKSCELVRGHGKSKKHKKKKGKHGK